MLGRGFMALVAVALLLMLAGCATYIPVGGLYSGGTTGIQANPGVDANKTGRACMNSVLALVAFGDASVETAMRNGGIKNVATVNYEVKNILGFYGSYCTVVSGN